MWMVSVSIGFLVPLGAPWHAEGEKGGIESGARKVRRVHASAGVQDVRALPRAAFGGRVL